MVWSTKKERKGALIGGGVGLLAGGLIGAGIGAGAGYLINKEDKHKPKQTQVKQ